MRPIGHFFILRANTAALLKIRAAGMKSSVMILNGLGGVALPINMPSTRPS
jgi:hypothetical protein